MRFHGVYYLGVCQMHEAKKDMKLYLVSEHQSSFAISSHMMPIVTLCSTSTERSLQQQLCGSAGSIKEVKPCSLPLSKLPVKSSEKICHPSRQSMTPECQTDWNQSLMNNYCYNHAFSYWGGDVNDQFIKNLAWSGHLGPKSQIN